MLLRRGSQEFLRNLWLTGWQAGRQAGAATEEVSKAMTEETLLALACVSLSGWTSPALLNGRARPSGHELTVCVSTFATVMINRECLRGAGEGAEGWCLNSAAVTLCLAGQGGRETRLGLSLLPSSSLAHAHSQTCDWQTFSIT